MPTSSGATRYNGSSASRSSYFGATTYGTASTGYSSRQSSRPLPAGPGPLDRYGHRISTTDRYPRRTSTNELLTRRDRQPNTLPTTTTRVKNYSSTYNHDDTTSSFAKIDLNNNTSTRINADYKPRNLSTRSPSSSSSSSRYDTTYGESYVPKMSTPPNNYHVNSEEILSSHGSPKSWNINDSCSARRKDEEDELAQVIHSSE